jgi:hypothetical protein
MKALNFFFAFLLISSFITGCSSAKEWRSASRESSGLAPKPEKTPEAVLQVYGADSWGWRGWFAIHTWVAAKPSNASEYTVYDVVGWRAYRNQSVVGIYRDIPDRFWYGAKPRVLAEHKGPGVDDLIDKVDKAARSYPWSDTYKAFPGPNSNTFVAWIGREVPELELELPFSAIGSGYAD